MGWPISHDPLWAGPIPAGQFRCTLPLAALIKAIQSQQKKTENKKQKGGTEKIRSKKKLAIQADTAESGFGSFNDTWWTSF